MSKEKRMRRLSRNILWAALGLEVLVGIKLGRIQLFAHLTNIIYLFNF